MKRLLLILLFLLSSCSKGVSEDAVPTEQNPTSTPGLCNEETINTWKNDIKNIALGTGDDFEGILDLVVNWLTVVNSDLPIPELQHYHDNAVDRLDKMDLIETPKCLQKASEHLENSNTAIINLAVFIEKQQIVNATLAMEKMKEEFEYFYGELVKLGLTE